MINQRSSFKIGGVAQRMALRPAASIASRRSRPVAQAGKDEPAPPPPSSEKPPVVREYKAYGVKVIESNESLKGPEAEQDFWEGEQFTQLGDVLQRFFLPGLVILAIICGVVAANTYNEGATVFQTPATSPDDLPDLIPAERVLAAPSPAA